jgi:hypothetical protein
MIPFMQQLHDWDVYCPPMPVEQVIFETMPYTS